MIAAEAETAAGSAGSAEPSLFTTDAVAYSPSWRTAAAALRIFSRGGLLLMLAALTLSATPPSNPFKMMRLFAALFLAPELASWFIARAFAASIRVDEGRLRIESRDETIEIPLSSIAAAEPWRVPVPALGLGMRLRSGRRIPREICTEDPVALVDAMIAAGAASDLRDGLEHPLVQFARARLAHGPGRLENPFLKFVLFSLVPTIPIFRLHQYIAYGGAFGEYYTYGLQMYLVGFGIWWAKHAIWLVLIAAAFRAVVEVVAFVVAAVAPSLATGARLILEIVQRLIFYIGIPLLIYLRLTA